MACEGFRAANATDETRGKLTEAEEAELTANFDDPDRWPTSATA